MREIFNKVIMVDFFGVAATKTTLVFAKIVSNHYYKNHKKVSVIWFYHFTIQQAKSNEDPLLLFHRS